METTNQQPTVLLLISDLLFAVKLTNDLRRLGYEPRTVKTTDLAAALEATPRPVLLLLDLMLRGQDWAMALQQVREQGLLDGVPVVGFGPHTDVELRKRALASGLRAVVANRKAMTDLPGLLKKYVGTAGQPTEVEED